MATDLFSAVNAMPTLDLILYGGIILMLVLFIIVGTLVALWLKNYKVKFRIRHLVKGRTVIQDVRARSRKDADGNYYLHLNKVNEMVHLPDEDAVDINEKGKRILEAYRTQTGEYIFISDKPTVKLIPDTIIREKDTEKRLAAIEKWKDENNVVYAFHPFTSNQRSTVVNQVIRAQQRKRFDWKANLPTIVGIAALVILVVSLLIFYGEVAKPVIAANAQVVKITELQTQQLQIIKEIQDDVQVIQGEDVEPPN